MTRVLRKNESIGSKKDKKVARRIKTQILKLKSSILVWQIQLWRQEGWKKWTQAACCKDYNKGMTCFCSRCYKVADNWLSARDISKDVWLGDSGNPCNVTCSDAEMKNYKSINSPIRNYAKLIKAAKQLILVIIIMVKVLTLFRRLYICAYCTGVSIQYCKDSWYMMEDLQLWSLDYIIQSNEWNFIW